MSFRWLSSSVSSAVSSFKSSKKNKRGSTSNLEISQADDPVTYFSSEVVFNIFSLVPEYDLLCNCQLVCKRWKSFVTNPYLWQSKIALTNKISSRFIELATKLKLDWAKLFMKVINKNLLNTFSEKGQLSLSPWQILADGVGDVDGWAVEQEIKDESIKGDKTQLIKENGGSLSNYAASYGSRRQVVDLVAAGLHPEVLDELQPTIEASEWYGARSDCSSTYWVRVTLLDGREKTIVENYFEDTTGGEKGWCKYSHSFNNYGPGVRYVKFWDQGVDTQCWDGGYGCKIAAAVIKVSFN